MKTWKKSLILMVTFMIAAAGYGWFLYNKKPADIRTVDASAKVSAIALVDAFNTNEETANQSFLDKVIAVSGTVADVSIDDGGRATVFLRSNDPLATVTCSFYDDEANAVKTLKREQEVTIKGKCTGKLIDVVLNKCSVEK